MSDELPGHERRGRATAAMTHGCCTVHGCDVQRALAARIASPHAAVKCHRSQYTTLETEMEWDLPLPFSCLGDMLESVYFSAARRSQVLGDETCILTA